MPNKYRFIVDIGTTRVKVIEFTPAWGGRSYYADGSGAPPEPAEVGDCDVFEVIGGQEVAIPEKKVCDMFSNDDWYEELCNRCQAIYDEREAENDAWIDKQLKELDQ